MGLIGRSRDKNKSCRNVITDAGILIFMKGRSSVCPPRPLFSAAPSEPEKGRSFEYIKPNQSITDAHCSPSQHSAVLVTIRFPSMNSALCSLMTSRASRRQKGGTSSGCHGADFPRHVRLGSAGPPMIWLLGRRDAFHSRSASISFCRPPSIFSAIVMMSPQRFPNGNSLRPAFIACQGRQRTTGSRGGQAARSAE